MTEHGVSICAYYARGFSLRETAEYFRVTHECVRQVLIRCKPSLIRKPYDTTQNSTGKSSGARYRNAAGPHKVRQ